MIPFIFNMATEPGLVAFVVHIMPVLNTVYLGEMATFTCDVTIPAEYTLQKYVWVAPESVVRDGRYLFQDNRRILRILDVTYEENNNYVSCNAVLTHGEKGVESFGKIVIVEPTTKAASTSQVATTPSTTSKIPTRRVITTPEIKQTTKVTQSDGKATIIPKTSRSSTKTHPSKDHTVILTEDYTGYFTESTESDEIDRPRHRFPDEPDTDEYSIPPISGTGIFVIIAGIIIVVVVFIGVLRKLRKDNEKEMAGKGNKKNKKKRGRSSVRALLYNRHTDDVTEVDSNGSPSHNRMYARNKHAQYTNSYEEMTPPTTPVNGGHSHGSTANHVARSNKREQHAFRTASNYSIISSNSYDNITLMSMSPGPEHKEQAYSELQSGDDGRQVSTNNAEVVPEDHPDYATMRRTDLPPNHPYSTVIVDQSIPIESTPEAETGGTLRTGASEQKENETASFSPGSDGMPDIVIEDYDEPVRVSRVTDL